MNSIKQSPYFPIVRNVLALSAVFIIGSKIASWLCNKFLYPNVQQIQKEIMEGFLKSSQEMLEEIESVQTSTAEKMKETLTKIADFLSKTPPKYYSLPEANIPEEVKRIATELKKSNDCNNPFAVFIVRQLFDMKHGAFFEGDPYKIVGPIEAIQRCQECLQLSQNFLSFCVQEIKKDLKIDKL